MTDSPATKEQLDYAIVLLTVVRGDWYRLTGYSQLKQDIDKFLDTPRDSGREEPPSPAKSCSEGAQAGVAAVSEIRWVAASDRVPAKDDVRQYERGMGDNWHGQVLGFAPNLRGGTVAIATSYNDVYDGKERGRVMLEGHKCTYWQRLPENPK